VSESRSMCFAADVTHLASVRDFASIAYQELGAMWDRDDLLVVVGELAANAAIHQRSESRLILTRRDDETMQVDVVDRDPTIPAVVHNEPWDLDGHRGLPLVDALSVSWGVEPSGDGKRVWAILARVPAAV